MAVGFAYADTNQSNIAIKKAITDFFYCFQQKKYRAAYKLFSQSLKEDIPYYKFSIKAETIKEAEIKQFKIYDSDKSTAKVLLRAKLKLIYKGSLYRAMYRGTCTLLKEKNEWKLLAVTLKAEESTLIQHIDFVGE